MNKSKNEAIKELKEIRNKIYRKYAKVDEKMEKTTYDYGNDKEYELQSEECLKYLYELQALEIAIRALEEEKKELK